jgi:DNA-binding XRE family transcriptional regulator
MDCRIHGSLQFLSSPIHSAARNYLPPYTYDREKYTSQSHSRHNAALVVSRPCSQGINFRFGNRLRELRRERNMTQLQMAVDFGIDRSFISDVERGQKSISLVLLEVIALGMKIQLADLLRGL